MISRSVCTARSRREGPELTIPCSSLFQGRESKARRGRARRDESGAGAWHEGRSHKEPVPGSSRAGKAPRARARLREGNGNEPGEVSALPGFERRPGRLENESVAWEWAVDHPWSGPEVTPGWARRGNSAPGSLPCSRNLLPEAFPGEKGQIRVRALPPVLFPTQGCSRCRQQLERWDGAGWDSLDPSRASCTSLGQSICWRSSRIPGSILVSLGSSLPLQCPALIPKPRFPQNSQLVRLMRRRTQSQALGGRAVPSPSSPGSGAHRGALGSFQAPLSRACSYLQTGAGTGSGASPGFLGMLPRDPGSRHSRRGWRSPRTPPEGQDALRGCHRSPPAPNPGIWDH